MTVLANIFDDIQEHTGLSDCYTQGNVFLHLLPALKERYLLSRCYVHVEALVISGEAGQVAETTHPRRANRKMSYVWSAIPFDFVELRFVKFTKLAMLGPKASSMPSPILSTAWNLVPFANLPPACFLQAHTSSDICEHVGVACKLVRK